MFVRIRNFITNDQIKNKTLFYSILALLVVAIAFAGLNGSLQNHDESYFAFTARDALEHKSWIIQWGPDGPTFYKSPMVFWASMLSFKAFGVSDFSGKLPSALAGIVTAFALFFICKQVFKSYKVSFLAVLIYECSIQVHVSTHQICTDVYYQMFLLLSLLFCIKGIRERRLWFLLAGVANGLVFLSKSALGLIMPASLLLYVLFDRNWKLIPYLVAMFFISLVVSMPFFTLAYFKEPVIFKELFLDKYLINAVRGGRSTDPLYIAYGFVYFFTLLIVMLLPFTPGCLYILFRKKESLKTKDIIWTRETKLLSLFFLTSYIGFSVIRQRLPHYTLPMIPALAIYIAYVYSTVRNSRKVYISHIALASLALVIFIGFLIREGNKYPTWKDVAAGLIAIYVIFIAVNTIFYIKQVRVATGMFFIVVSFFVLFTINVGITIPMDFNHDIREFSPKYQYPAPIHVIYLKGPNEGNKWRTLYWYTRQIPKEYHKQEGLAQLKDQIEPDSYVMYYAHHEETIKNLLPSLKVVHRGRIWDFGIYE